MQSPVYIQAAILKDDVVHLGFRNTMQHPSDPNGFPSTIMDAQGRPSHFVQCPVGEELEEFFREIGLQKERISAIHQEMQTRYVRLSSLEGVGLLLMDDAILYEGSAGEIIKGNPRLAKVARLNVEPGRVRPLRGFDLDLNERDLQERLAIAPLFEEVIGGMNLDKGSNTQTPGPSRGFEIE